MRKHYAEIFLKRDLAVTIVGTVSDALRELKEGDITRLRANYINDDAPSEESILYAQAALRDALLKGVPAEIWTGNSPYEVSEALRTLSPGFVGKISIYSKNTADDAWFTEKEYPLLQASGEEGGIAANRLL